MPTAYYINTYLNTRNSIHTVLGYRIDCILQTSNKELKNGLCRLCLLLAKDK